MDTSSFDYSSAVIAHIQYFGIAIVAVVVFVAIYVTVTPHREFTLIRQGNTAAAMHDIAGKPMVTPGKSGGCAIQASKPGVRAARVEQQHNHPKRRTPRPV